MPASTQLGSAERGHPVDPQATIALNAILAGSRWWKRFAILGALAVAGVAASVPLVTSHRAPVAVVDTGAAAPVAVIPASDLGRSTSLPNNDYSAPAAAPIKNAEGAVPPAAAAPEPRATIHNDNRITSPLKQGVTTTTPQRDTRAAAAEAYARARADELKAHDQRDEFKAHNQRWADQRWARFKSLRP